VTGVALSLKDPFAYTYHEGISPYGTVVLRGFYFYIKRWWIRNTWVSVIFRNLL